MPSPLAHTFGIWLIAQFFQAILFGMGLLQVYLYFLWYNKDSWGIKSVVILMTVLESVQTGTYFSATYKLLIDDFGNFEALSLFPWQALAQLEALYMATWVAETYFAYCIYLLHKRRPLLPCIIAFLALIGFGGGTAQVVLGHNIKKFAELPTTSAASNTQAALALTCDVLITIGLCWRLNSSRTGIQSTNQLLNFLIMTAINRGLFTMITALLNLVLFLTQPGTFYFMLSLLLSGKFYMNSMLAMLNTRQHAHSIGKFAASHGGEVISMPAFPSTASASEAPAPGGVNVSVRVRRDHDLDETKTKPGSF
ncbi:hypothetical protein B0H15DRAFT_951422 [Mycena belliarum]|uniref:DUF6534 domain-containing protein n=1 Tax=Mycena belliarum TaxID=1033014 RepID=A0AAD6XKC9_9AGAR|nr:hypothetical protein B0H15DRAFT_951422 [Mycena belliae]